LPRLQNQVSHHLPIPIVGVIYNRNRQLTIAEGEYKNKARDFSRYLNNWEPIEELNS